MKKSLHSSLQNQIWLTTVMVKKQGPSQTSFVSYRKLVGHQRVHQGGFPHCTLKERQWTPSAAEARDTTGTKPSKQYNQSQVEARWKRAARKSFNCYCLRLQFRKSDVTTEEISSQFDSRFPLLGFNTVRTQNAKDSIATRAAIPQNGTDSDVVTCSKTQSLFESLFVLCISLTQSNVENLV